MSGLISYSELQQSAPLPVAIDYPAALALRQMALIDILHALKDVDSYDVQAVA